MKIGARLRDVRLAKGFSIYKLSKETYISQNHISAIENDKRQPTLETLERLIAPLGITLAELVSEHTDSTYLSEKEKQLIGCFRSMTSENSDLVLSLTEALSKK